MANIPGRLADTKLANSKKSKVFKTFVRQKYIQAFVIMGMLYILIFFYIPMIGNIIAFKNYSITTGLIGMFSSEWAGFKYFKEFFTDPNFWMIIRNTVGISVLKLIFSFPLPIIFAILINEIGCGWFKRFVQTVSYLPHFISWVVVSGIIFAFLSEDGGVINVLLQSVFSVEKPVSFLTDAKYFWGIAVISDAWKEFGWWAIIFISAITVIDPNLYEAASIDGAGRLSKIKNITLPGIKGAICIVLILSIGNLLGGGLSGSNFEQSYLMGNGLNNDASEVIQTYVLKTGLVTARYSFATAVSIFQSIFSVILVLLSNLTLKKVRGESLF